jgi:hypothetical protein
MMLITWFAAILIFCNQPLHLKTQKELVQVRAAGITIQKGKSDYISVEVMVKDGYHIQANKVNDESLIPVSLKIFPAEQFVIGPPEFPPYTLFRLEGTDNELNVFDGKFEIKVPVKAKSDIAAQTLTLKAALYYQACDHKSCLFPRTINFEIAVLVK